MASAFWDRARRQWIADFRPYEGKKQQRRRVRVPADVAKGLANRTAAKRYALRCESYCRELENAPSAELVRSALELGAITEDQAKQLAPDAVTPTRPILDDDLFDGTGRLLIVGAAMSHPASQNEMGSRYGEFERHLRETKEFCTWADVQYVDQITLPIVQRYVTHLKAQGYTWISRKHRLSWLRRATHVGASHGRPDRLAKYKLDRNTGGNAALRTWTRDELAALVAHVRANRRGLAALALAAGAGLRPSEICRVNVGDIEGTLLHIGRREAKNATSKRTLPIPTQILDVLAPLCDGPPDAPLLRPERSERFTIEALQQYWHHCIVGFEPEYPIRAGRKTFASLLLWGAAAPQMLVEAWMGHKISEVAPVTAGHYLDSVLIQKLRPITVAIGEMWAEFLPELLPGCVNHAPPG